jgi:hypothetical protein
MTEETRLKGMDRAIDLVDGSAMSSHRKRLEGKRKNPSPAQYVVECSS